MAFAEAEAQVEPRIARLESDVSHIRSDLADVKQDVRDLRARVDKLGDRFEDRINAVERSLASTKVWALLLFIAQAAAVYGTLARTMGWI